MARFDGKKIRGIVGDVVFKDSEDGKSTIVQAAPVKVRLSKGSKGSNKKFGQASVLAGVIRKRMEQITQTFHDTKMALRSDAIIRDILNKCFDKNTKTYHFPDDCFKPLVGFEFNKKSLVTNSLYVTPEVSLNGNQISVNLPEIQLKKQLKFPKGSNCCEINVIVSFIALEKGMIKSNAAQSIEVESDVEVLPAQEFTFDVPDGVLCVVGLGLTYFSKTNNVKTLMISKAFKPANVCGTCLTPGVFVDPGPVKIGNKIRASPWTKMEKMKLGGVLVIEDDVEDEESE